jgi:predicted HicB family RNase H-like nuclease
MIHEGYVAEIDLDQEAGLLNGVVLNTRATLHFAGRTVAELRNAFAETIEDYREWCRERGVEPEKPYSGTLSLRIAPELHKRIAEKAAQSGQSINQFITRRLEEIA